MLKFKEFSNKLDEQAEAMKGNCNFQGMLGTLSLTVLKTQWQKMDEFSNFKGYPNILYLYKHKHENTWILGEDMECEEDNRKEGFETSIKFVTYFKIKFSNVKNYGYKLNIKPLYNVNAVMTDPDLRGQGIAKFMYRYFIKNQGYNILGDKQQFFGARKLWKKLSEDSDITVDIIDIKEGVYIDKNVIIHHGDLDDEFDKRIWKEEGDTSTHNIRLILKDIK